MVQGQPLLTFAIILFSKKINSETDDPDDLEILTDEISDTLFKKGYLLLEDSPSPVPTSNDLYQTIIYVGKETIYQPN